MRSSLCKICWEAQYIAIGKPQVPKSCIVSEYPEPWTPTELWLDVSLLNRCPRGGARARETPALTSFSRLLLLPSEPPPASTLCSLSSSGPCHRIGKYSQPVHFCSSPASASWLKWWSFTWWFLGFKSSPSWALVIITDTSFVWSNFISFRQAAATLLPLLPRSALGSGRSGSVHRVKAAARPNSGLKFDFVSLQHSG